MHTSLLIPHLQTALGALPAGPICVGYSGGMDSLVLLHALARMPQARERGLSAIHVDHGLHSDSADWAQHCRLTAAALQLPLRIVRVAVARSSGEGLEAAARSARQAAFRQHLPTGGVLALAHHADDQSETVLLKLLRGAGPEGLRGMRPMRRFGSGSLWRPLLGLARSELAIYARAQALDWIDDPSNADPRHARNFLRQSVLPQLRARWPRLDTAIGHSARWLAASAEHLDADAELALAQIQGLDPATLRWRDWLSLSAALRPLVLRRWLRGLSLPTPEHVHIDQLQQQLTAAAGDRNPRVSWAGAELRRYRDLLYALAPLATLPTDWEQTWDGRGEVTLPADCGRVQLDPAPAEALELCLRLRRGGEHIRRDGDAHTRELRDLLQQAGIPPWQRGRIPLLYGGAQLLAVGDLWLSTEATRLLGPSQLRWQPPGLPCT